MQPAKARKQGMPVRKPRKTQPIDIDELLKLCRRIPGHRRRLAADLLRTLLRAKE
jgi:hypothetical protein